MVEYNPIVVYFVTLFVCLALLVKAIRDMCTESNEEETQTDNLTSPLITPEVYVIPIHSERQSINNYDDSPPTYDVAMSPPSYEEYYKKFEAVQVSSTPQQHK
ncbi:hypothetical protein PVAND_001740 [Polypedilum vanderplanki]|uniref:Uncharacterized protein n=1 Tax=Polypedilum vanderplanki TaxID=319348 RepID=A0A9J6BQ51_POLVA|nr:hypothetical protein PVAND_001740 [Polypedilum vanderplanki]